MDGVAGGDAVVHDVVAPAQGAVEGREFGIVERAVFLIEKDAAAAGLSGARAWGRDARREPGGERGEPRVQTRLAVHRARAFLEVRQARERRMLGEEGPLGVGEQARSEQRELGVGREVYGEPLLRGVGQVPFGDAERGGRGGQPGGQPRVFRECGFYLLVHGADVDEIALRPVFEIDALNGQAGRPGGLGDARGRLDADDPVERGGGADAPQRGGVEPRDESQTRGGGGHGAIIAFRVPEAYDINTRMSSVPVVSVVIPTYNAAGFIEKTLDSIKAQTFGSYEVIVVDDGSKDDTKGVVDAYFTRTGMAGRCIRQPNKKIAGARNTGMRAARGRYIALLDHDDLWYPRKLEVVLRAFEAHPEADLICHAEDVTKDGRKISVNRYGPAVAKMYERLLFLGNTLSPSAVVFDAAKAQALGGFDENPDFDTVEDYDFWLRFSRAGKFHFIEEVLGEYVLAEGAASRRIMYHHGNAESLLRRHFSMYSAGRPGLLDRLRMRRRIASVQRSALRLLIEGGESPAAQRECLLKMLREFPVDPKNLAVGLLWAYRSLTGARS
jgi:glycosyltransferase involved in cell wall biosynthesis